MSTAAESSLDKPVRRSPSPAKVLRGLFWKLLFRGRAAQQAGGQKTRRQIGLGLTMLIYALVGLVPALFARNVDIFVFACTLHGFTFMFASLTLASSAGTMLFMKEEAEILLHRPVTPQQMLRAKCAVLAGFALMLALALNLAGFVTGLGCKGATWRFIPAHLFSTALLMVFSASSIVLVYNACLKWFGRERLDNLLATVQSLLTVVMIMGGQIMPRVMQLDVFKHFDHIAGWMLALPPLWFGALDALLTGTTLNTATLWLPAGLAVSVTALTSWLALEKLGSAYGQGLMNLNESAGTSKERTKPRGVWLAAIVKLPPLRWWLRDPVERESFKLTTAYLFRDREIKLRLYPGIAPMLIMPLVMLFSGGRGSNEGAMMMQGFATCFLGMVSLQAMMFLGCSEHWRAAAFFHVAPLRHWSPLFHGSRKAVIFWLSFPVLILQTALICGLQRSWTPLMLSLPAVLFLPTFSLVTGLMGQWLPLSKPSEDVKNTTAGCLMMGGSMAAAGIIGGLSSYMWHLGHFGLFLALEALVMLGATILMKYLMRDTPWVAQPE
jgi:ABC-2 type transport system permease protein